METLTIFTPTYNRAKFLPRAFEALKRQTLKDFLWMIIDDGSTDNTEEVVQDLLKDTEAGFKIEYVKKETLLIDLASNPGGIDKKAIKDRNLKFVWSLSLPGKVAPTTSAEFIKNTIYNILREIYKV